MEDHERAVVSAALAILSTRLRQPGAALGCSDAKEFMTLHLAGRCREAFGVAFLDSQSRLVEFAVMFEGTLSEVSVYPREVARRALELNAAGVILAHNHPTAPAEPSTADEQLTRTLVAVLRLVGVSVLDSRATRRPIA